MSGNFAIKGGGVGPLMANAILNFHFDFLTPSLIQTPKNFLYEHYDYDPRHIWYIVEYIIQYDVIYQMPNPITREF